MITFLDAKFGITFKTLLQIVNGFFESYERNHPASQDWFWWNYFVDIHMVPDDDPDWPPEIQLGLGGRSDAPDERSKLLSSDCCQLGLVDVIPLSSGLHVFLQIDLEKVQHQSKDTRMFGFVACCFHDLAQRVVMMCEGEAEAEAWSGRYWGMLAKIDGALAKRAAAAIGKSIQEVNAQPVNRETPLPDRTPQLQPLPPIDDPVDQLIWEMLKVDPDLSDEQVSQKLPVSGKAGRSLCRQAVNERRRALQKMGYPVR